MTIHVCIVKMTVRRDKYDYIWMYSKATIKMTVHVCIVKMTIRRYKYDYTWMYSKATIHRIK